MQAAEYTKGHFPDSGRQVDIREIEAGVREMVLIEFHLWAGPVFLLSGR